MRPISLIVLVLLFAAPALAEEPPTAVVEKTDFRQEVVANGRVAPGSIVEARLSPLRWRARYVVESAIEPGRLVQAGDVVMQLDDREIHKALDDARFSLSVAEWEFRAQMQRLRMAARGAKLELTGKQRELEVAQAALKNYLEFTLPRAAERAERDARSSARSVENARDELDQLEKMYAEDELVDETEEIVLKRARWDLENRLSNQKFRREQREFEVSFTEQDRREALEFSVEQRRYAMDRAQLEFDLGRMARDLQAEKALRAIEEQRRHVFELAADLADFTLTAPRSGLLLHGDREGCLDRRLKRGDQLAAGSVAFFIADPGALVADLTVPADEVLRLSAGQTVRIEVAATGFEEGAGTIVTRDILPRGGRLAVTVAPEKPLDPNVLGVSVKARVVVTKLEDVMVLPLAAVHREGTKALCRRPLEGGGTRLVPLILGPDDGKRVVVLEGLEEGDVVLLEEPRE